MCFCFVSVNEKDDAIIGNRFAWYGSIGEREKEANYLCLCNHCRARGL